MMVFGILLLIPIAVNASTINYGAFARSGNNDNIDVSFKFNKRLSHVSAKYHKTFSSVAVYDSKIQNKSRYNVRFYFSKLWFVNLTGNSWYDRKVFKPKKAVVVRAHTTRIVTNSFRDTLDATYSYYEPKKKEQYVIQYYWNNHYYLAAINSMHLPSEYTGWHPTWTWSR